MDALHVISNEFPNQPLGKSTAEHPLLHSRITELQVRTLLDLNFSAHEIWTKEEIHKHLMVVAKTLNSEATNYSSPLTDDGFVHHYTYVHKYPQGSG